MTHRFLLRCGANKHYKLFLGDTGGIPFNQYYNFDRTIIKWGIYSYHSPETKHVKCFSIRGRWKGDEQFLQIQIRNNK